MSGRSAQAAALAQEDGAGVRRPGHRVPLLVDVGRTPPGGGRHDVVVVLGEPGARVEARQHRRAHGDSTGHGTSMRSTNVARSVRGRCRVITPKPMASTSRAEVVEPRGIHAVEVGCAGMVPAVARPGLGVLSGS